MKVYRKIWQKHYGDIPVDENGIAYDIHHIDGNRANNAIENLIAVSIKEHYDIHKNQGDWQACHMIGTRLNLTIEEQLEINKKISEALTGYKQREETKAKLRALNTGQNSNRYGTKHSKDTLKKMSDIKMGDNNPIRKNPNAKDKISKAILGSKWMYRNDNSSQVKEKDIQTYIDNGWKFGRLYKGKLKLPKNNNRIKKKDIVGKNHPNAKPVSKYDKEKNFIRDYETITEAVKDIGKSSIGNITLVCLGLRKTAAGFIWKFKN